MAGYGYNSNINNTNNMDFTNTLGLNFGAVFDDQQQSFGKLDEGNTSTSYPFFTADEGIDTTTGQFNMADQSIFSMPSADSSFNIPQELVSLPFPWRWMQVSNIVPGNG